MTYLFIGMMIEFIVGVLLGAFNSTQQELARRASKRKKSDRTKTEQGKYSSKYALTEIMVCDECGSAYKRSVWDVHGKRRQPVWRCICRMEHGKRYCKNSPTLHEETLQRVIVNALNSFFESEDEIRTILKSNVENVLIGTKFGEIKVAEQRLREIDEARNDYIALIASGAANDDALDEQFQKFYEEEQELQQKISMLKQQSDITKENNAKMISVIDSIDHTECAVKEYNDLLVRKTIECIKVISKQEIKIIFKGGFEVKAEIE